VSVTSCRSLNLVLITILAYIFITQYESHTKEKNLEDPEIAIVGTKGQIVIPQEMRRQLAIKPRTKLAIYRKDDKLVVTKVRLPTVREELDELFNEIDVQNKGKKVPSNRDVLKEIQAHRKERAEKGR
jgi:AbrB family looped-hinge helix DNA binding protein